MKTLTISDETYDLIKSHLRDEEKANLTCLKDMEGKAYFFRTVTYHLIGRVKAMMGNFAILEGAAWVADSGRFTQAIQNGTLSEVEPVGEAIVNLSTVTDMFPWKHPLPTVQK